MCKKKFLLPRFLVWKTNKWGDALCCFEVLFQQTENNIMTKRLGNIPIKCPMLWMSKTRLVTSLCLFSDPFIKCSFESKQLKNRENGQTVHVDYCACFLLNDHLQFKMFPEWSMVAGNHSTKSSIILFRLSFAMWPFYLSIVFPACEIHIHYKRRCGHRID